MQYNCEQIKNIQMCENNYKCVIKNNKCHTNCNNITLFDCYNDKIKDCPRQCNLRRIYSSMAINNNL